MQALVRDGILKGIRGPRGGYELARAQNAISAEDILRAANAAEDADATPMPGSDLVNDVVWPALREAERVFSTALAGINIEDMMQQTRAAK